ncbi:MAG: alpha-hydroxy-acid oxidizing protein [Lachnospiraceae bacterium]|nr:alpha-hydroxy-acid oxidizing protein [Lachnospiraceae bacterium]
MEYAEVLRNAKEKIGPNCKVCPVCNGIACGNTMPGPGSKAPGLGANVNYKAWRSIRLNMDTMVENGPVDTKTELFGRTFEMPLITAPIGSIKMQYNPTDDVKDFNEKCMAACETRGIMHAYGDGLQTDVLPCALASGKAHGLNGIPVFNPDTDEAIMAKMDQCVGDVTPPAICVVVDSAGLPHLRKLNGNAGCKSVDQLKALKEHIRVPFILKGIMSAATAKKAVEAGADAIIVSNHGGRVLADTPATAEVLPEIVEAVKGQTKIIVDGGIRSGLDMFKALAMGADMCMICRPVLISYYGGGQEGMECYFDKLKAELSDTMYMCGARSIADIKKDMIRF